MESTPKSSAAADSNRQPAAIPTAGERHTVSSRELPQLVEGSIAKDASGTPHAGDESCQLNYYAHRAMGCEFAVYFPVPSNPLAPGLAGTADPATTEGANSESHLPNLDAESALDAFELVDYLESLWTTYRADSEISRLNQCPVGSMTNLSAETVEVLLLARHLSQITDGAFDIAAASLTRLWHEASRAGHAPAAEELDGAVAATGLENWQVLESLACRHHPQTQLDLGAIGKGFALDAAAALLRNNGIEHFLLHGGNSSVLGIGDRPIGPGGWQVGLTHPLLPDRRIGTLSLNNQSLGTSGTRRQGFFLEGRWHGHIVDPRSGQPGDKTWSATVIAPTAATADALATAFYVMQLDEVESFCQSHPDIAAVLVRANANTNTSAESREFTVELFNLNAHDVRWE